MSIVDAHVHLWDPRETPRAVTGLVRTLGFSPNLVDWVSRRVFPRDVIRFFASPKFITRKYLPSDFQGDCGDIPIRCMVHVEAGWQGQGSLGPVAETRWLDQLPAVGGCHIGAIIAHADLGLGASVANVLRAHVDASNRVRGIRDMLAWHSSRNIMNSAGVSEKSRDPEWRRGFESLSDFHLSFDATCYDIQLHELADLAGSYPEQPIILSHAGTPIGVGGPFGEYGHTLAERQKIFGRWQEGMARLAECRNVAVKISGLTMPVCGFGFESRKTKPSDEEVCDALRPLVSFVLETFGVPRCMFASNYPVEKVSVSYKVLWDAYSGLACDFSVEDRVCLVRDNAVKFYGLQRVLPDQ